MQKILSIADKTPTYRLQDADTSTPFEFLPPSPLVSLYILLLSRFASLESRKRSRLPVFTRSRCGGIGWAGVSILNRHTFNHARLHVGHVGRARLHGESCGADGKDMGRMRPVGGMERRAPRRAAFPLAAGFAGILCGLWPPCGAGMAKKSSRLTFIGVRGRLFKPECPEHLSLWAFLSGKPLFLAPPRHVLFV